MNLKSITMMLCVGMVGASACSSPVSVVDLQVEVLEDRTAELEVRAVQGSSEFRPLVSPNFGYSSSAFWGRLTVHNRAPVQTRVLLELAQPYVERADLFWFGADGQSMVLHGGRDLPFSQRAISHRLPVFPLDLDAGETRTLFLRVAGEDSLSMVLRAHTREQLARDVSLTSLGFGLYYGLIAAMALYNLFLAFVTKDRRYLTYVLAITTAHGFFSLVESGLAFEYWWPEAPVWNKRALPFSIVVGLAASLLFCQQFLETAAREPKHHRALSGLIGLSVVHSVVSLFLPFRLAVSSAAFLALLGSGAVLVVSALALQRAYTPARFFLLGWSCVSVGTAVVGLKVFGLMPTGWFFDNAFRLGSSFEVLLLSFALGDRITMMRRQATAALREAQARTDALNAELKLRVADLETSNQEVSVLNDSLQRQIRARTEVLVDQFSQAARTQSEAGVLRAGTLVESRYRVVRLLGSGGMGAVYEVERVADQKRLALKVLSAAGDPVALARFAREANVIASLRHPNVVSVVDVEIPAHGLAYLVMELVPGASLKELRSRFGDVEWAGPLLGQLAAALSAAHRAGVVHRDVKPANVIVGQSGHVTLVDFGASALERLPEKPFGFARPDATSDSVDTVRGLPQAIGPGGSALTQAGHLVGTPRYMAPELAAGALELGPPADIFAFGILAYEILGGRAPFDEPPLTYRLTGRPLPRPPPLTASTGQLSQRAALLLERCLLETASLRPSAEELEKAVAEVAPSRRSSGSR